jgi:hypothetical protein
LSDALFCIHDRLYLDILGKQRDIVSGNEARYKGGLQKLADTERMVGDLQTKLTEMKPSLERAAKCVGWLFDLCWATGGEGEDADALCLCTWLRVVTCRETAELLVKVEADQAQAEIQQSIVQKDVEEANKVAAEVQVRRGDASTMQALSHTHSPSGTGPDMAALL